MLAFLIFVIIALAILIIAHVAKKRRIGLELIILAIGLYWGVTYLDTIDMPGYVDLYSQLERGMNPRTVLYGLSYYSFEPAFLYLMQIFKEFGAPFCIFQTVLLLFEVTLVGIGLSKFIGDNKMTTIFLVAISLYLPFWLMAALRQGIPIAVFIFVLPDVVRGKYLKSFLLIFLSSLFHSSGIFLILLILLYMLYKKVIVDIDANWNLFLLYTSILLFCDIIYIFGFSLSDVLDRLTMLLFSDNPFIYRDYTIMSNASDSNYGIFKFVEMNVVYLMTFYLHPQKQKDNAHFLLESLFLIYFILNTVAGGIIIHRLSYFLIILYYYLFYKELHRLSVRLRVPGFDTIIFVMYLFLLFFRQYRPFTSYVFEYFTA